MIDDRSVGTRATACVPQRSVCIDGGQALVHQTDGYRTHSGCEPASILARGDCRRTFDAGQGQWQAHHHFHGLEFSTQFGDPVKVLLPVQVTGHGLHRGRDQAVGIADRDPDPGLTDIDADTSSRAHVSRSP